MSLSPIVLFVYNRIEHTRKTIDALKKNFLAEESELIIYSDGPKNEINEKQIIDLRQYLKSIKGFKNIVIIERKENIGLSKSIINGVSEVLDKYGKVIVLEDDLVSSPYFLKYMNESLDLYENNQDVISIHGYIYPVKSDLPETFFLKGADCWGWGTWKRGWEIFNPDAGFLKKELKERKLIKEFDFYGGYPYYQMLTNQIKGKVNSWAIMWYASAFLKNKLTLYPGKTLINHIGNDGSGTNTKKEKKIDIQLSNQLINITEIPIEENKMAYTAFENYFKSVKPKLYNIFFNIFKSVITNFRVKNEK